MLGALSLLLFARALVTECQSGFKESGMATAGFGTCPLVSGGSALGERGGHRLAPARASTHGAVTEMPSMRGTRRTDRAPLGGHWASGRCSDDARHTLERAKGPRFLWRCQSIAVLASDCSSAGSTGLAGTGLNPVSSTNSGPHTQ